MTTIADRVSCAVDAIPLIAILRGLVPAQAEAVGQALGAAGFRLIEVPLNSPQPFQSIRILRDHLGDEVIIGAGTVLSVEDVQRVYEAGGEIVVSPNSNPAVIKATLDCGLVPMPGFMTPGEAFQALDAGAEHLKLFPATNFPVDYVSALRSVLPDHARLFAVGGIDNTNGMQYLAAGCNGLGLGSSIFTPSMSQHEIATAATRSVGLLGRRV